MSAGSTVTLNLLLEELIEENDGLQQIIFVLKTGNFIFNN